MSLAVAALIVSAGIAVFTVLPWFFISLRKHSKPLLFVGTFILLGFVFFDLIPEMVELGGPVTLLLMAGAWIFFSLFHSVTARSHETHHGSLHNEETKKGHNHAVSFLLGSMALHCFAGGMLLVGSYEISQTLAYHVFLGLVAHKVFEAVSVSSLLIEKVRSRKHLITCAAVYALSFPLGVGVTILGRLLSAEALGQQGIERVAVVITSIAIGSLFGCLLQDFLIPSIKEIKNHAVRLSQSSST